MMIHKSLTALSTLTIGLAVMSQTALAQRPSGSQGPPQLSFERAWAWLMDRPGVIIALVVIAAAIAYMLISKRRSRT